MRASVYVQARTTAPPELIPALIEGFVAWRERYRSKMEAFEFFAGGGGGLGIVEVADEAELHQMMIEFPFGPWSTMDVRPIVDGDTALGQWQARMAEMSAP
jgi:muconolactone delta-isomerase